MGLKGKLQDFGKSYDHLLSKAGVLVTVGAYVGAAIAAKDIYQTNGFSAFLIPGLVVVGCAIFLEFALRKHAESQLFPMMDVLFGGCLSIAIFRAMNVPDGQPIRADSEGAIAFLTFCSTFFHAMPTMSLVVLGLDRLGHAFDQDGPRSTSGGGGSGGPTYGNPPPYNPAERIAPKDAPEMGYDPARFKKPDKVPIKAPEEQPPVGKVERTVQHFKATDAWPFEAFYNGEEAFVRWEGNVHYFKRSEVEEMRKLGISPEEFKSRKEGPKILPSPPNGTLGAVLGGRRWLYKKFGLAPPDDGRDDSLLK